MIDRIGSGGNGYGAAWDPSTWQPEGKTVEANSFVLLDKNNKRRGVMTMTETGPGLFLTDAQGNVRAGLSVTDEGAVSLLFYRDKNTPAIGLLMAGGTEAAGLTLYDKNGTIRARFSTESDGRSAVVFDDPSGTVRATANMKPDGTLLVAFLDHRAVARAVVFGLPDGTVRMGTMDEDGKQIRGDLE